MLNIRVVSLLAALVTTGMVVAGSAPASAEVAPCALWTRPAGTLGWGSAAQMPQLDLRSGAVSTGADGMRYFLTVASLPAPGASLIPNGASAIAWEMRWSYAGSAYYAAVRATAAAPGTVTYEAGSLLHGTEVPGGAATGTLGSGAGAALAIQVPGAMVGSPTAGADLGDPIGQVYVTDLGGSRTLAAQGGPGAGYRLGQPCAAPSAAPHAASSQAASSHPAAAQAATVAGQSGANGAGLRTLGELELPAAARQGTGTRELAAFPIVGNRAYYMYQPNPVYQPNPSGDTWMLAYDLSTPIPKLVGNADVGAYLLGYSYGRDTRAIDAEDGLGLVLDWGPAGSKIVPIDLTTLKVGMPWDLTTGAPAFTASGITYSASDHRAYLVGDVTGNQQVQQFAAVTARPENGAVISVDPKTGAVDWMRVITGCHEELNTYAFGSLIAKSRLAPALYFACWQGDSGNIQLAGQADVVRLWVKPGANQADALTFPVDEFPISGQYVVAYITGTADFDYGSDRFFLLSQSTSTPGAWVLDGSTSSWAGFISAPDYCDDYLAVDSSVGRLMMAANGQVPLPPGAIPCPDRPAGWVLTSDGRQLPPSQGVLSAGYASSQLIVDSASHRFFLPQDRTPLNVGRHDWHVTVVADYSPAPSAIQPVDYDSLTNDIAEGAGTTSDFAGGAHGYGSRLSVVGGTGAVIANSTVCAVAGCVGLSGQVCSAIGQNCPGVEPGDRAIYAARAGQLDLRPIGATSSAQALQPDTLTSNDLIMQSGGAASWPWSPSTCLDAGGGKLSQSQSGPGSVASTVACDLKARMVTLSASAGALDSGAGLTVGASQITSKVWLDPQGGTETDTTSIAQGIDLTTPAGGIRIGRVLSEAKTAARGRHGTAAASLRQLIEHFVVVDPSGNVILACATVGSGGCDPTAAASAANSALNGFAHVTFPQSAVTATKGGAFAEVRKSNTDFYNDQAVDDDNSYEVPAVQLVVFNDGQERSRVLVQLAGVQASSIYEITQVQPTLPLDDGQLLTADSTILGELPPPPVDTQRSAASRRFLVTTVRRFAEGLGILFRSPLQAIGIFAFLSLFGLAAGATWRRRALSRALITGGTA